MKGIIADALHPSFREEFRGLGIEFDYFPEIDRNELIKRLPDYDLLLLRSKTKVDAELLAEADRLKIVARAGAGLDNFDVEYLEDRGIAIINAAEGNRDAVGDHTVGLILAMTKRLVKADAEVRDGRWHREENRGVELNSQTVGIIGFGNTGMAVARRLEGFGCRMLVYDKYKSGFGSETIREVQLSEIFAEADILSLHIPLSEESWGLVDEQFLAKFRKNIYLVNTSRGEILSTKSLVTGLDSGKILGAALDVLENEKISELSGIQQEMFDFLRKSNKVVLSPHVAGWSVESYVKINKVLAGKIRALLKTY